MVPSTVAQCHILNGVGGEVGPDLSTIGPQRSLQYLRDSILDPSADVPTNYRADTVTTMDGNTVTGIHLNEDDYSIQLRDSSGNPRSFLKSELKGFTHERRSIMPPYRSLAPAELDSLIAYLKAAAK